MYKQRLRCCLVGAGTIGRQHARVIAHLGDDLELAAVVSSRLGPAGELALAQGATPHKNLAAALTATRPDVVIVCTPSGTHAELTIEALRAGCHVLVEKPADVTVGRIDAMVAARERAGRVVAVVSQHRFDPASELLLAKVAAGELGRLTSGVASIDWYRSQAYYDSGGWRGTREWDGGGALMNQGIHTVDLLLAALGRPVEVVARTATLSHERIEVEDVAAGVVTFENGALGILHATTAAYPGLAARLQIHGDRGSIVIEGDALKYLHTVSGQDACVGPNQADLHPLATSRPVGGGAADPTADVSTALHAQYLDLLAAIRTDTSPRVGLEENRAAVAVITSAYESSRTGRPVSLA